MSPGLKNAVAEDAGSRLPEVQAGVRAVSGVVSANVRWPEPAGPATLYVVFAADLDSVGREQVTRDVMAVLQRIGGVDLATLQARPTEGFDVTMSQVGPLPVQNPEGPALASVPRAGRPVFTGLNVDHHLLDIEVAVQLMLDGQTLAGRAKGIASATAELRTVAAATLDALRAAVAEHVRLELEWVRITEHAARTPVVESAVTVLAGQGEQIYLGSVLSRGDTREAVVRATLDALNRPLSRISGAAA
jgi:hypothetical protein